MCGTAPQSKEAAEVEVDHRGASAASENEENDVGDSPTEAEEASDGGDLNDGAIERLLSRLDDGEPECTESLLLKSLYLVHCLGRETGDGGVAGGGGAETEKAVERATQVETAAFDVVESDEAEAEAAAARPRHQGSSQAVMWWNRYQMKRRVYHPHSIRDFRRRMLGTDYAANPTEDDNIGARTSVVGGCATKGGSYTSARSGGGGYTTPVGGYKVTGAESGAYATASHLDHGALSSRSHESTTAAAQPPLATYARDFGGSASAASVGGFDRAADEFYRAPYYVHSEAGIFAGGRRYAYRSNRTPNDRFGLTGGGHWNWNDHWTRSRRPQPPHPASAGASATSVLPPQRSGIGNGNNTAEDVANTNNNANDAGNASNNNNSWRQLTKRWKSARARSAPTKADGTARTLRRRHSDEPTVTWLLLRNAAAEQAKLEELEWKNREEEFTLTPESLAALRAVSCACVEAATAFAEADCSAVEPNVEILAGLFREFRRKTFEHGEDDAGEFDDDDDDADARPVAVRLARSAAGRWLVEEVLLENRKCLEEVADQLDAATHFCKPEVCVYVPVT